MSSRFTILGAGNSTGVPWLKCVMDDSVRCSVCEEAMHTPLSRNNRNNPSALLTFAHPDGRDRHILIDCGKTFRESVLKSFTKLGVKRLDAVIITHAHADAYMGLDDLRDVAPDYVLPVYLAESAFKRVGKAFAYLVQPPRTGGLFIASLSWRIIQPFQPFLVEGLVVTPFPVEHGEPRPMLGFDFRALSPPTVIKPPPACVPLGGSGSICSPDTTAECLGSESTTSAARRLVYISDVAGLTEQSRAFLLSSPVDVLVMDALSYKSYPTHYSFKQALACALDIGASQVILVGMNHRVDYHVENPKLEHWAAALNASGFIPNTGLQPSKEALGVPPEAQATAVRTAPFKPCLGYDGLSIHLDLHTVASLAAMRGTVGSASLKCVDEVGWKPPHPHIIEEVLHIPTRSTSTSTTAATALGSASSLTPSPSFSSLAMARSSSSSSELNTACHASAIVNYASAILPDWDDGASPSRSANQVFEVHYTTAAPVDPVLEGACECTLGTVFT